MFAAALIAVVFVVVAVVVVVVGVAVAVNWSIVINVGASLGCCGCCYY